MLEFVLLIVVTFMVPIVLEQSSKRGHFEWVGPWIREGWTIIFIVFVCYFLWGTTAGREVAVRLNQYWREGPFGYIVMGILGALIFCGYWAFIGRVTAARADAMQQEKKPPETPQVQQHSEGAGSLNTSVIGNNNIVITTAPQPSDKVVHKKLDEIERLLKDGGKKDDLLTKYPLGYIIFEVDSVTKAVTPLEARQGLENYQFDFRPVGIVENTADRIAVRMPDLIKDKKVMATGAVTGGWKRVGNLGGASVGDAQGGVIEWAEILAIKGSEVTFLIGFDHAPKLPQH